MYKPQFFKKYNTHDGNVPVYSIKAYSGSRAAAPLILKIQHYVEVSWQLHAPAALGQGKKPRYPLNGKLDRPQSRSGRFGEENAFAMPGIVHPTA
jgi:hypothetical protein